MKPVGTFLDFTRLYVYVYSMFTFGFFSQQITGQKYNIAWDIVHIWTDEKNQLFWILLPCLFLHGPFFWNTIPSGQTVLFYAVM